MSSSMLHWTKCRRNNRVVGYLKHHGSQVTSLSWWQIGLNDGISFSGVIVIEQNYTLILLTCYLVLRPYPTIIFLVKTAYLDFSPSMMYTSDLFQEDHTIV